MKQITHKFFPEITKQSKWAFTATVLFMVVTHFYMFTNKIVNHDDVNRLLVGDTNQAKIQHGRWAGVLLDPLSGSSVSIPYVMGFLSILGFAAAAVVLVSVFQMQRKVTVIFSCGLLCTFPVSANIFLYGYIADVYFISMFLAVWGVWLILQKTWAQKGLGVVCLTLACGCYQAFWCFGMAFLFLYYLLAFLELREDFKKFVGDVIKSLLLAALSLLLYLAVNKIVQAVSGYGATAYEGLDAMGQFGGLVGLCKTVLVAYYEFVNFFYIQGGFVSSYFLVGVNLLLTLIVCILLVRKVREQKRTAGYVIVFLLFAGMIPLASNLVSVVSQNRVHVLMQYAFLLPYFLCLLLWERQDGLQKAALAFFSYICLFVIIYQGYLTDNEIYFRQQLNYEATYSYTVRMLSRIEETEGYTPSTQVAFINENPRNIARIAIMMENYPEEMAVFDSLNAMAGTDPHTFVKKADDIADFCKYYHGYDLQLADTERLTELADTDIFRSMPTYPQENSMQLIDGVLVVKLADERED